MSVRYVTLLILAIFHAPICAAESSAQKSELAELLAAPNENFPRAVTPRAFEFPRDHGPHPEFRNEWWYVTGNLDGPRGRRFGFELTIFRFALTPARAASSSAWRTAQVYIAHLAVTDPQGERFLVAEKFSRGALNLAGATTEPFAVWIDDWQIRSRDHTSGRERWSLVANSEEMSINLELESMKPPVLNGEAGLSRKSAEAGNASYYYSITRLATAGVLRIGRESYEVTGTSWLDREWSSSALDEEQVGWDWFALQLADGTDLMFYMLRRTDGSRDPNSAGTLVRPDGSAVHLRNSDVEIEVLDTWISPSGGAYPSRWRLTVPAEGIELVIVPIMDDQELFTTVRYWEGAVDVSGVASGSRVGGRGYVELTGYAKSFE